MKLSFSTIGCPHWGWGEVVAVAKDLGYDGIEIRGVGQEIYAPRVKNFLPENIDKTVAALKDMNLEVPCLTSGASLGGDEECMDEVRDYIALAEKFGAPYVRVMCEPQPAPVAEIDDDIVIERMKDLCTEAKAHGVTLLLETNGAYADSDRLRAIIEKIPSGAGVLWDIHHPYRYCGESAEYTYNNLKDYIRHVHVKDSEKQKAVVKYMPMGYGDVPVKAAVNLLREGGYDGYLSFEWVKRWYAQMDEPGIMFMQYIDYMKRVLK